MVVQGLDDGDDNETYLILPDGVSHLCVAELNELEII
jgi:hypothetical protein